jgi:glycyl-tRNA synthetase beta chain
VPAGCDTTVREDLIAAPAERQLLDAIHAAVAAAGQDGRKPPEAATTRDLAAYYERSLRRLSTLAAPVDRFFTDVLVMAEDEALRQNRLALLARVVRLIRPIADLSKLVVGETRTATPAEGARQSARSAG